MRKFFLAGIGILAAVAGVFGATPADAGGLPPAEQIVVFVRDGCEHCEAEIAWLRKSGLDFTALWVDGKNGGPAPVEVARSILEPPFIEATTRENLARATPLTFVGGKFLVGFDRGETTGAAIRAAAEGAEPGWSFEKYLASGEPAGLVGVAAANCPEDPSETCVIPTQKIRVPWTDLTVDPSEFSLPAMAAILGFIDGFNPCAMWVLVTFLIILAELGDRRKMALAAGLFLIAEAAMYFAILNGWSFALAAVNAISNFAGPAVGVVAVGAGGFFLWEAATVPAGECKVVSPVRRAGIARQIREVLARPLGIASAIGIVGIALSVNVIEFVCSVGIPQTYAQILEINAVGPVFRQILNGIYTALYMADDVVVFTVAVVSFGALALTAGKYAKIAQWLGGGLMVVLGGLLIFAPEVLRF